MCAVVPYEMGAERLATMTNWNWVFTLPHVRPRIPTAQESRGIAVHAYMRVLAVVLTLSVGVACGVGCGGSSRKANSPDDENSEEVVEESPSEEAESSAEAEESSDEDKEKAASRPAKKRRPPKRRRHVEAAPAPEPPPVVRKPPPPPPVEEPAPEEPAPAPAYVDNTEPSDDTLEAEARRRCRWKNVAPYRPEWANAISPPVQRKITSKPICPYGTPPAVLRVARQIAVQQTKTKR